MGEMGGLVGSVPVCYGSSLGSYPDKIYAKWATKAKDWPTHSSPPNNKALANELFLVTIAINPDRQNYADSELGFLSNLCPSRGSQRDVVYLSWMFNSALVLL